MISPATIQQILGRLDIIDVIGGFVKLKKRGANYLGLCPFHNEKTPSFTVSPAKEIYKCFGCGKSGNTVSFIMEHEKYSYAEALKWLANKYGIEIEETFVNDEQRQQMLAADSLYIINAFAQQFFTKTLFDTEEGQDIGLSYLKERGFREDVIIKFQLGYSPDQRDAFTSRPRTSFVHDTEQYQPRRAKRRSDRAPIRVKIEVFRRLSRISHSCQTRLRGEPRYEPRIIRPGNILKRRP